jgi:lipopolysaccharide biosynthesis glycosyltransferase
MCINDKYAIYCTVLIASIRRFDDPVFHIFHDGLSQKSIDMISSKAGNVKFYLISEDLFSGIGTNSKWPSIVYYRLFAAELLPENLERVLYLDCDIYVRGSLKELYTIELGDKYLAAAEDVLHACFGMLNALSIDPINSYFNSGVMLIDLNKWRKFSVIDKAVSYSATYRESIIHPDQDCLNYIFQGRWKPINKKWNFLKNFQNSYSSVEHLMADYQCEGSTYPVVIHFSGVKPWKAGNHSIFKYQYHRLAEEIGYGFILEKVSLKSFLIFYGLKVVSLIGRFKLRTNYYL